MKNLELISSEISEERKEKVMNALNLCFDAIIENGFHSNEYRQGETASIISIIMKIVEIVDVPDDDIPRLFHELFYKYKNHDFNEDKKNHDYISMDYEAMFMCELADLKIFEYKQKKIIKIFL